ncbi:hypothetical protein E2C01_046024 [Portunus trituberculatus]|uniref:Uncharacterized protein n=1 Tax=Portunus trituberculatus TaxID=210409 RepID=A0A5B7FZU7_PORTR|nr:hypothetical protein [Portunus trituberculatus]
MMGKELEVGGYECSGSWSRQLNNVWAWPIPARGVVGTETERVTLDGGGGGGGGGVRGGTE